MKIDKISLQILYPTGAFANVRPAMEATLEDGDTPEQCLTQLKERLDNWFWEAHPELSQQRGTTTREITEPAVQVKKTPIEQMEEAINSCTEVKVLETFKLIVKNRPQLQGTYDNKLKQLT